METKTNPGADLQSRYPMHLAGGFIISIGLVLMAFEWTTRASVKGIDFNEAYHETYLVPDPLLPQVKAVVKPPPKPPKKAVIPSTTIKIAPDSLVLVITKPQQAPPDSALYVPEPPPEEAAVYENGLVDEPAVPQGGWEGFGKYLRKNLKYPRVARQARVEGKVFISFVVDPHGVITQIKVLKGIGFGCDKEAVRVVSELPDWVPARRSGLRVAVRMVLPIQFKLD